MLDRKQKEFRKYHKSVENVIKGKVIHPMSLVREKKSKTFSKAVSDSSGPWDSMKVSNRMCLGVIH